jgi:O-acetylhomoserine/O-acetylserine sulfhydrylase-like pyridoxal-dependent enzyme
MTHSELTDKFYRRVLANELLVLRRSLRQIGETVNSDYAYGVRTGLDTFARRLQEIHLHGLEWVYQQNYKP